jgi:hypothetical protein
MTATFSENEVGYLTAWAIEDHLGQPHGPARILQKEHQVHPVVLGNLFAMWCRNMGRNQLEIVDGPYPQTRIEWPWRSEAHFESRVRELLPENAVHYLEEFGGLKLQKVPS